MKNKERSINLLYEFARPHKKGYVLSVVLAIIGVIFGFIPYYSTSRMVIGLIDGVREVQFYLNWCLIAAVCFILKAVLMSLSTSSSHEATFRVLSEVRRRIASKLTKVPMGYLINTPSGNLKNSMVERIEQLEIPLAHVIPEMTSNILVPLGIIIYIFILDWRMAFISLITIPIGLICYMAQMKEYPKKYKDVVQAGKNMGATTVEYIGGIEVIKAFNQSAASYSKFTNAVQTNANLVLDWMKSTLHYSAIMMSVWPAVLIGVLPAGCWFYLNNSLEASTFITIAILSLGIIGPIVAAMFFTDDIAKIGTVIGEIKSVLDEEELKRPNKSQKLRGLDIKLKDVRFGYEEEQVLNGINLNIKKGKVTALVGSSGSGKSTISKLIASFWDVNQGKITIGGVDIKDIPIEQLTDMIAYVSQDNYLFNDTIRNNIRMGKPEATDIEVESIAEASGCHEFIMGLEDGYDTIVGGSGGHLSGGERQRIAIARAMMKDAPIIILDEATSYADPENEAIIQDAVGKLTIGKTLIVIAHRLSTIIDADQIAVVNRGKIVGCDRHENLLKSCSLYIKMWNAYNDTKDEERKVI